MRIQKQVWTANNSTKKVQHKLATFVDSHDSEMAYVIVVGTWAPPVEEFKFEHML
jgi:FPC/CPF motif-containing protein YcgG